MAQLKENLELTTQEKECLRRYREHKERYGAPPTIRQLADYLDLWPNSVQHMLKNLEKKGYLVTATTQTRVHRWKLSRKGQLKKL